MEIESGGAPPRTLADVSIERDQEGRATVSLHHPGRHDSYHSGMPPLRRQDEPGVALGVCGTLDLLQSLVEDALIQRLTLGVERLELVSQGRCLSRVV